MRQPYYLGIGVWLVSVCAQATTLDTSVVKVSAARSHLVLGQDRELKLQVTTPPELTEVRLTTNVGRVSALSRQAPGRWQATYYAPKEYYPQVAIIVATAGRSVQGSRVAVGVKRLALWGRGEAEVKTQRRAEVTVRIGDKRFGPARANDKGIAKVNVIVPPGVKYGWDGDRKVDLKLPPMRRLHGVVVPERYDGTRSRPVTVLLVATDPIGAPEQSATPKLTGSAYGAAGGIRQATAGLWHAEAQAPAGKPATIELNAFLPTSALAPITISLSRVAGAAAVAKLTVNDEVSDDRPITVKVQVTDKLGTPVAATIQPTADMGDFSDVREAEGEGSYQVRWRPPRWTSQNKARLSIVVNGQVVGSTTVPLSYPANAWRRRLHPAWFYVAAGVSGALLISGVVTRGIALDKSSEYKDPATTIERRRDLKDSGEPLTDASSALLGIGAAAVVGLAVVYYFTDWGYARERLALQPSGRSLLLGARF